jgi:hypothetical protein
MKKLIIAALAALACCTAAADQSESAIQGIGVQKCEVVLKARKESLQAGQTSTLELFILTWVQGYLGGMNTQRAMAVHASKGEPEFLSVGNSEEISNAMVRACRKDPSAYIWNVARQHWLRLIDEQVK